MGHSVQIELVPCQVPETCPDTIIPDPTEESGLVFLNLTWPIIAYRFATYVCNDSSLITDEGKDYQIQCLEDGTFANSNLTQLVCREPFDCPDYVPYPTMESKLKGSFNSFTISLWPLLK